MPTACSNPRYFMHPKYVYHAEPCKALNYEETTGQKVDALANISIVIYVNVCQMFRIHEYICLQRGCVFNIFIFVFVNYSELPPIKN